MEGEREIEREKELVYTAVFLLQSGISRCYYKTGWLLVRLLLLYLQLPLEGQED